LENVANQLVGDDQGVVMQSTDQDLFDNDMPDEATLDKVTSEVLGQRNTADATCHTNVSIPPTASVVYTITGKKTETIFLFSFFFKKSFSKYSILLTCGHEKLELSFQ
jgi:hypothetical protein